MTPYIQRSPVHYQTQQGQNAVGCDESAEPRRIFLIAVRGGILPPVIPGQGLLQRLQILLHQPGQPVPVSQFDDVIGPLPALTEVSSEARGQQQQMLSPRPVRGELLCDESGRMYEWIGRRLKPVRQIVSGPRGQILEVSSAQLQPGQNYVKSHTPSGPDDAPSDRTVASSPPSFRKLVRDPGLWRVVRWGEFKHLLASQIAQPHRLRDAHRVPCYVQVYETHAVQSLTSLATAVFGDAEHRRDLQPLTDALASRLGLTELLETQSAIHPTAARIPGLLAPRERLVSLSIAEDPTAVSIPLQHSQKIPVPPVAPPTGEFSQSVQPARLKCAVPERYLKQWEFRLSRDEVLYDMQHGRPAVGGLAKWMRRLTSGETFAHELQKWRALLSGKSLDEQLWAIRPPKDSFSQPEVREWLLNTLHQAGYDPQTMASEWEIYWRRKGV